METETYQNCLGQSKRINNSLDSLDQLVKADRGYANGEISYEDAIDKIISLGKNSLTEKQIPVTIKPERPIQIQVTKQWDLWTL